MIEVGVARRSTPSTRIGEVERAEAHSAIERGSLQSGETLCVRMNGHRLALVTILDASEQAVEFGTTVWDPPVPS